MITRDNAEVEEESRAEAPQTVQHTLYDIADPGEWELALNALSAGRDPSNPPLPEEALWRENLYSF